MDVSAIEASLVGSKHHPKPWMVPAPVKILPTLQERMSFTHFQHMQRFSFYVCLMGGTTLLAALLLQLVVSIVNLIYRRNDGYRSLAISGVSKSESEFFEVRLDSTHGAYSIVDIYFTMYLACYQMFCAATVILAVRHDYIDVEFGMNFEMYVPWVIEAIIVHIFSVIACIRTKITRRHRADIPSPLSKVIISLAPFLGERFNLLRDWVTLGIYLYDGHPVGKLSAAIVFLSLVACVVVLFNEPKLVLSMRLNFWPVAKQAMIGGEGAHYDLKPKTRDAYDALVLALQNPTKGIVSKWRGRLAELQLGLICELDTSTQQHKVVNTLYGEIPQGVASLLFVFFSRFSTFVVICLLMYVTKVCLLIFIRPYVLCMMADAQLGWNHIKSNDLEAVLESRHRYKTYCSWQMRLLTALRLVKDMKEGPEEVAAALRGISRLILESDDDESASLVVLYTAFLREFSFQLDDHNESMKIVREATTKVIMQLCEGLEERDVTRDIPTAGNLGYLPTGGALKEVRKIINEMHSGEHDVLKLLSGYDACRFVAQEKHGRNDDLMVFFCDCDADDIMAIAQLWQYKIEKARMTREPVVIFGVDFAEKDRGTVFEKKHLLARLMLGVRSFFILTPDIQYEKEEGRKADHPSAEYWAGQRDAELQRISAKLREFKGGNINFYVLAAGRGCIASLLQRLKNDGVFPSKQKWAISVYSGPSNIKGMTERDIRAIKEFNTKSVKPLLDAGKIPFFGGADYHACTSSFTSFAPESFSRELNKTAHPFIPACLKLLSDEHNFGLVDPKNLYESKKLTRRERERLESLTHLYTFDTISEFCQEIVSDFALFAKVEGFKKSTITSFASHCCDSALDDQVVFLLELLLDRYPTYLKNTDVGAWMVNEKGFTSVDLKNSNTFSCQAMQPILAEPSNEIRLDFLRNSLQTYLLMHIRSLQQDAN